MKTDQLLILIPGNFSTPEMYQFCLEKIRAEHPSLEISVLCHLSAKESQNLTSLLNWHRREIQRLLDLHQPRQLFLMGHSLGAGMLLALQDEFKDRIHGNIFICPFLSPSGRNTLFFRLLHQRWIHRSVDWIFYHILAKDFFLKPLPAKLMSTASRHEVLRKFLNRDNIRHFLALTADYLRFYSTLGLQESAKKVAAEKSLFIYAPKDFWVPVETHGHFPDQAAFQRLPDFRHDFCLHDQDSEYVAKISSEFLRTQRAGA